MRTRIRCSVPALTHDAPRASQLREPNSRSLLRSRSSSSERLRRLLRARQGRRLSRDTSG
eukprot:358929-Alexandrium_andersonii.AAC.1